MSLLGIADHIVVVLMLSFRGRGRWSWRTITRQKGRLKTDPVGAALFAVIGWACLKHSPRIRKGLWIDEEVPCSDLT